MSNYYQGFFYNEERANEYVALKDYKNRTTQKRNKERIAIEELENNSEIDADELRFAMVGY